MRIKNKLEKVFYEYVNYYLKDSLPKTAQKRIAKFLKRTIYFFAIIGPIMTLPQVYRIWTTHIVTGFSLITWISYLIISFFWLLLGVFTKNKPIILANFCWVLLHIYMVASIFLYS